ncbi:phosphotransferase enzyme family protein [Gracilimonas sp.]|uniref:phosphotransferase enzyme family protein n=1 Tax=Gracilimonas sp. TaxID=1974203 RepID=UPI002871386D|nr:aminoglycoside phosphotransferase family protein [Gracilimonas sp.]
MNSKEMEHIQKVLHSYPVSSENISVAHLKSGLIHSSYKISTADDSYLLQQINTRVFQDVSALMENIKLVTDTLSQAYKDSPYESLEIIPAKTGELFFQNNEKAWRIYSFKDHLKGFESPKNIDMVHEAGKAFSLFIKALSPLNPDQLSVTIPQFHSLEYRHSQLQQSLKTTHVDVAEILSLIDKTKEYTRLLLPLEHAFQSGEIPTRITHNDSKFNNLLFDDSGRARCVVDLDTVMPGIIHFDVGDCLRTLVPTTPEDEPNLDQIELRKEYHNAFLDGFLSASESWFTKSERTYLPYAAPYMALIMGTRFLTDYLNGNTYYHCEYPKHNIVRARCQLEVVRQFLDLSPLHKIN